MDPEIRKLRKKLRQIEALERLERDLSKEEAKKVSQKDGIRSDLQIKLQQRKQLQGPSNALNTDDSSSFLTTAVSSFSSDSTGRETSFGSCLDEKESGTVDVSKEQELEVRDIQTACKSRGKEERFLEDKHEDISGGKVLSGEDQSSGTGVHVEVLPTTKEKLKKKRSEKKRVLGDADVLKSGKFAVRMLEGHNDVVLTMDCTGSVLITGSVDTMVKVWNADSGEELKSLGGHEGAVTSVVILPEQEQLEIADSQGVHHHSQGDHIVISGSLDCTFRIWSVNEGLQLKSVYTFSPLRCVRYSSKKVLTGSDGGKLDLWDVESCNNVSSVREHETTVTAMWFDFPVVVSGDGTGCLIYWNIHESRGSFQFQKQHTQRLDKRRPDPSDIASLPLYHYTVNSLCVNKTTNCVYWGDNGINVKMWNIETGLVEKLPNHVESWGSSNAITLCGSWVVAAGYDLDSGQGYLTVRSVDDNSYVATVLCPSCPKIECLASFPATGAVVRWRWCTGGKQLLVWDWLKSEDKPKRTRGPRSIVSPVSDSRFEHAHNTDTEVESELESDSDEDNNNGYAHKNTEEEQSQNWSLWNSCNIL